MGKYIIEDKCICPWYKMEKEESIVVCNFPILGKYLNSSPIYHTRRQWSAMATFFPEELGLVHE